MTTHQFKLKSGDTLVVTVGDGGSPPPPPPGGGGSDPSKWPNVLTAPMWGNERRTGNGAGTEDCPPADPRTVVCVPINIPAGPFADKMLHPSVSRHGGTPAILQAVLSRTPGDFATPLSLSEGTTATPSLEVGTHVMPGDAIFFCFRFYSTDLHGPSTDVSPQPVSYGGGWPS